MSLAVQVALLRRVPMFAQARSEELAALAMAGEPVRFEADHMVCQSGVRADAAFVILSGTAEQIDGLNGATRVQRILGPATLIGELALFIDTTYHVTIRARTDVEALSLTRDRFRRALMEIPALARGCADHIGARLQSMATDLESVHQRLG